MTPAASVSGRVISSVILCVLPSLQILRWQFALQPQFSDDSKVIDFQFVQSFPFKNLSDNFQTLFMSELTLEAPSVYFFKLNIYVIGPSYLE